MQKSLYQTADAGVTSPDSDCRRQSINQRLNESLYQTADAGVYQTADAGRILSEVFCMSSSMRHRMK